MIKPYTMTQYRAYLASKFGVLGGIRTHDPLLRRQVVCQPFLQLWDQKVAKLVKQTGIG
jgi:hypothetical protein